MGQNIDKSILVVPVRINVIIMKKSHRFLRNNHDCFTVGYKEIIFYPINNFVTNTTGKIKTLLTKEKKFKNRLSFK